MEIIECDLRQSAAIMEIFNDAIVNSTVLYDYKPRTPEMMAAWFEAKRIGNFPVIGAVNEAGVLMGFGSFGHFRAYPAYKYTVEHSVYVAAPFRGQGLGKRLLTEVIARAKAHGMHVMVGVIDSENEVSIRLHQRFGFEKSGTVREVGFKFGRWLDISLYQLVLETPLEPEDG